MRKIILGLTPALVLMSASAASAAPDWKVSEVSGAVRLTENGASKAAIRGALLSSGAVINTGADARAVIVRGEEFVVISPNSQLRVPAAAEAGGVMQMIEDFGVALFKIRKKATPHFGVQTPYLAAVVKGTTFTVTVGEEGSTVQVTEGAVEVSTLDGGASDLVTAGIIATVAANERFQLRIEGDVAKVIKSDKAPVAGGVTAAGPAVPAYQGPAATVVRIAAPVMEVSKSLSEVTGGLVQGAATLDFAAVPLRDETQIAMQNAELRIVGIVAPPDGGDGPGGDNGNGPGENNGNGPGGNNGNGPGGNGNATGNPGTGNNGNGAPVGNSGGGPVPAPVVEPVTPPVVETPVPPVQPPVNEPAPPVPPPVVEPVTPPVVETPAPSVQPPVNEPAPPVPPPVTEPAPPPVDTTPVAPLPPVTEPLPELPPVPVDNSGPGSVNSGSGNSGSGSDSSGSGSDNSGSGSGSSGSGSSGSETTPSPAPVTEPVVEPALPPAPPPTTEPGGILDPIVEPIVEPVAPIVEPVAPVLEPVLDPITQPLQPILEPVIQPEPGETCLLIICV